MEIFLKPELFDILGFLAFLYILFVSVWSIKSKSPLPKWVFVILLIVALTGAVVDGGIVYTFFLK